MSEVPAEPLGEPGRALDMVGDVRLRTDGTEGAPWAGFAGDACFDAFARPRPCLRGRREEQDLDLVLAAVGSGRSAVLVLRGEAGIGKTDLLEYVLDRASEWRTSLAVGVEPETALPYAGLHQLCAPLIERIANLPAPQRDALATAFGLRNGPAPEPFLVGLATFGLLADSAREQPLVCAVDDTHWLDAVSLQVLAFVARRVRDERIALIFAVSDDRTIGALDGLPELHVRGLHDGDARALLGTQIYGPVDEQVRDRILSEARGSPGALLELPHAVTAADLVAGFAAGDPGPFSSHTEARFVRRLDALPDQTRRVLLAAAAEPVGDAAVFWLALDRLGIDRGAIGPAEAAGLIDVGARIGFCHPSARSAVYRSANLDERQDVHAALAEVTDAGEPVRRAWHLALSARGKDGAVAAELEAAVGPARARAGLTAAAALLDRAALLTPEPALRAERGLAAAAAKREAGDLEVALRLLVEVMAGPADRARAAMVERVRGHVSSDRQLPRDAARLLGGAAARMEATDARTVRDTHLEALVAAVVAGPGSLRREAAEAALAAPAPAGPTGLVDEVLPALAGRVLHGGPDAMPSMRRALDRALATDATTDVEAEAAGMIAVEAWDFDTARALARRRVEHALDAGALVQSQHALDLLASLDLFAGSVEAAAEAIYEGRRIAERTGVRSLTQGDALLAALRGEETATRARVEALLEEASARGHGRLVAVAHHADAILRNGLGDHEAAAGAALRALAGDAIGWWPFIVSELAEAASRTRDESLLGQAIGWVADRPGAVTTDWAVGMEARVRALLSGGDVAERLHRRSIERLRRTVLRVELARGHLLYGEWLRREGRRVDARSELQAAHDLFVAMGLAAFAERARRELQATGETVRRRSLDTGTDLTPQEAEIARLAGEGMTNPEIGVQLFLSPRTVEWHLRKVFPKLGITSRRQLREPPARRRPERGRGRR